VTTGNTSSKQERRNRAFCFRGNAQIAEAFLNPVGKEALVHLNRVLGQWRASNRSTRRQHDAA
jgi:hypothetical protein